MTSYLSWYFHCKDNCDFWISFVPIMQSILCCTNLHFIFFIQMYISPNAQQETFSMYDVIVFQFCSHNLAEQKYFFSSYSLRANIFYNLTTLQPYNVWRLQSSRLWSHWDSCLRFNKERFKPYQHWIQIIWITLNTNHLKVRMCFAYLFLELCMPHWPNLSSKSKISDWMYVILTWYKLTCITDPMRVDFTLCC